MPILYPPTGLVDIGDCLICCKFAGEMEHVFNYVLTCLAQTYSASLSMKHKCLARMDIASQIVFSDSVIALIAQLAPDTSWYPTMRSGTVVVKLIQVMRKDYDLFNEDEPMTLCDSCCIFPTYLDYGRRSDRLLSGRCQFCPEDLGYSGLRYCRGFC